MPSKFQQLMDEYVEPLVDDHYGEEFRFTPMKKTPNGRPGPDEDREVIEGVAPFEYESVEQGIQLGVRKTYREANDLRAIPIGRSPLLIVDRKYFPTVAAEPRQGDVIEILSRPDLAAFDVVSCQRDGMARLYIELVHRGSQS
jgi:hypothetical protein